LKTSVMVEKILSLMTISFPSPKVVPSVSEDFLTSCWRKKLREDGKGKAQKTTYSPWCL
jgi:hypothetical protein